MNKICRDNPFGSHEISPIVILRSLQAKMEVFLYIEMPMPLKSGHISIGGGYKDRSGSANPYDGDLVVERRKWRYRPL